MMNRPIAASSSASDRRAWPARSGVPRGAYPGKVGRHIWLMVSKNRSIFPRPRGLPCRENTRRIFKSMATCSRWREVKSRAVVGVEGVRDAADVPAGFALAPDRLAQGQGRLQRRGGVEVDRVPGD